MLVFALRPASGDGTCPGLLIFECCGIQDIWHLKMQSGLYASHLRMVKWTDGKELEIIDCIRWKYRMNQPIWCISFPPTTQSVRSMCSKISVGWLQEEQNEYASSPLLLCYESKILLITCILIPRIYTHPPQEPLPPNPQYFKSLVLDSNYNITLTQIQWKISQA